MSAAVDYEPIEEGHAPLDVICWRIDQLAQAGYPVLTALRLAENPDVDLHRACELLERGATVGEALRILL